MSIHHAIYKSLRETAHKKQKVYYGEIAPLADLDMIIPKDRKILGALLDEINREEIKHNRPLLSAVVVRKDTRIPGVGFFRLAQALDLSIDDKRKLHQGILDEVHDYWSAKLRRKGK
jgi:hypothetical protein